MKEMLASLLTQQAALNKDGKESQEINITITDTGPGFEWRADNAGVIRVEQ